MVTNIEVNGVKCDCVRKDGSAKIVYVLYPAIEPIDKGWLERMAAENGFSLVLVYIPSAGWNDMLTPWPEPGETPDSPPFGGNAADTFKLLQSDLLPAAEEALGLKGDLERVLVGVSLSGLFALWQWLRHDTFKSIASLSGSFWYEGFMEWFDRQVIPLKTGKAFFLLGDKEPDAWIKAYRSVGVNTKAIVERLHFAGITAELEWVPGNHFADPLGRLERALAEFRGERC